MESEHPSHRTAQAATAPVTGADLSAALHAVAAVSVLAVASVFISGPVTVSQDAGEGRAGR